MMMHFYKGIYKDGVYNVSVFWDPPAVLLGIQQGLECITSN